MSNKNKFELKKNYLKKYKKNNACIQRLINKKKEIEHRINTISSPTFSDMPKGTSHATREDLIVEKMELEERIVRLQEKGSNLRREVVGEIDKLDDPVECDVLERVFIYDERFEDIADAIGYNYKSIIRIYSRAVHKLSEDD